MAIRNRDGQIIVDSPDPSVNKSQSLFSRLHFPLRTTFLPERTFSSSQSEPHPHFGGGAHVIQKLDNHQAIASPTESQCAVRPNTKWDKGGFLGDNAILPMWKYKHRVVLQQPGTIEDKPNLHFQSMET